MLRAFGPMGFFWPAFVLILGSNISCSRAEYIPTQQSLGAAVGKIEKERKPEQADANPGDDPVVTDTDPTDSTDIEAPVTDITNTIPKDTVDGCKEQSSKCKDDGGNTIIFGDPNGDLSGKAVIDWGEDIILTWATNNAASAVLTIVDESRMLERFSGPIAVPAGQSVQKEGFLPGVHQATLEITGKGGGSVVLALPFVIRPTISLDISAGPHKEKEDISGTVTVPSGAQRVELFKGDDSEPFEVFDNVGLGSVLTVTVPGLDTGTYAVIANVEDQGIIGKPSTKVIAVEACPNNDPACIKDNNEDSCKKATEKIVTLGFSPRKECPFGQGDNLSELQGYLRARVEDEQVIPVTEGHVLCGIKNISSKPGQKMRFDDHFMLNFNQQVILSSFDIGSTPLEKKADFFEYDWLKLRGDMGHDISSDFDSSPYCIADSNSCKTPPHDMEGDFYLDLDEILIDKLMKASSTNEDYKIRTILLGDNNAGDCELATSDHQDLEVNVTILEAPKAAP